MPTLISWMLLYPARSNYIFHFSPVGAGHLLDQVLPWRQFPPYYLRDLFYDHSAEIALASYVVCLARFLA